MVKTCEIPDNATELKARQAELLEKANEELRRKVDWVIEWYKCDTRYSLVSRWELGSQVGEVIGKVGKRTYGANALATLSVFSGEAAGMLRLCARIADEFTNEQVNEISEMRMSDGFTPLSFSHLRTVLAVKPEERASVLKLTTENCWTSTQLGMYVKKLNGGPNSNNSRGRPVGKPKNVAGVIQQQLSFAEDFDKRNVRVWKNSESSVSGQLEKVEESQYTEELAEQLGQLALRMRQLAAEAGQRAEEAEQKHDYVRESLTRRYADVKLASELSTEEEIVETPTRRRRQHVTT